MIVQEVVPGWLKRLAGSGGGAASGLRLVPQSRAAIGAATSPSAAAGQNRRTSLQPTQPQDHAALQLFLSQFSSLSSLPSAQSQVMLESGGGKERVGGGGRAPPAHYHYVSHLRRTTRGGKPRSLGKALDRNAPDKKKRVRKMSKRSVARDVFLGGSCNPTTWRKDVAIPLLEDLGITYYNPQVAEWTEELISAEHNAKESAAVLFYVLDRRTRNVVGIIELAHFAGCRRDVVLVTDPFREGEPVAGENISSEEYDELMGGLATLGDLVSRQGIRVHRNITDAIKWTAKILNNTSSPRRKSSLKLRNGLNQSEIQRRPREILNFDKSGKGELNLSNVCLAYCLSSNNKTITDLNGISTKADTDSIKKSLEQLCAEMRAQNGSSDMFGTGHRNRTYPDIYIGGSDTGWKDGIALPILSESRVNYMFAELDSPRSSRASPAQAELLENSKVLLFIITNQTRGLDTMTLASYFIGCQKNVVLCLQNLAENTTIAGEQLSKIALKDYNRGRAYLSDLAVRAGVPVVESIEEAVRSAVSRASATATQCNPLPPTQPQLAL